MLQKFICVSIEDTAVFINTQLIQRIYQLDADVVVEMNNGEQYIVSDTNILVFMDRFV